MLLLNSQVFRGFSFPCFGRFTPGLIGGLRGRSHFPFGWLCLYICEHNECTARRHGTEEKRAKSAEKRCSWLASISQAWSCSIRSESTTRLSKMGEKQNDVVWQRKIAQRLVWWWRCFGDCSWFWSDFPTSSYSATVSFCPNVK